MRIKFLPPFLPSFLPLFIHFFFLQAAKMATYIKNETVSTGLFVLFLLVWILSRLIIFPF